MGPEGWRGAAFGLVVVPGVGAVGLPEVGGRCHGSLGVVFGRSSVNCCSIVMECMWLRNCLGEVVNWGGDVYACVSMVYEVC